MKFKRISKDVIERFRKIPTPCISDALDKCKINGQCEGIKPIVEDAKIAGQAFTVKYIPVGVKVGTVGDYIDDVTPRDVVVIDNAGRTYCTVWGDLLTKTASKRGVAATVIDGVCRDVPGIKELRYPVFSIGYYMRTGKDRVQCQGINVPVAISGVQVNPGDLIVGDGSGVVVIPLEKVEEVLKLTEEIYEREEGISREIDEGHSLKESRERYGYHKLQRGK